MAGYAINNQQGGTPQNLAAAFKTLLEIYANNAALTRAYLYDLIVGTDGAPANNALNWDVSRMTVSGTGTAVTPAPLNPVYGAMSGLAKANDTVEPTVTAASNLLPFGLNQQASFRWVAGREGLTIPAVANNGLVVRAKSAAYTSTATAAALVEE